MLAAILLAQDSDNSTPAVFMWSAVLIVVVAILFVAITIVRKKLRVEEDVHGEGFSLGDLRQMHKDGKLSTEEYDRAKAKMVESLHAAQALQEAARAEAAKRKAM